MIRIENLTRTYGSGDIQVHALSDVSLTIKENEFVAVMGTSGSGKSTLMNILGCLDTPTSGEYILSEQSIKENLGSLLDAIVKTKPSSAKGSFIKKLTISSTMGPGIKIDHSTI